MNDESVKTRVMEIEKKLKSMPFEMVDGRSDLLRERHVLLGGNPDTLDQVIEKEYFQPQIDRLKNARFATVSLTVLVGEPLFQFQSYEHWSDRAQDTFNSFRVTRDDVIALGAAGEICRVGKDFKAATYPVTVYRYKSEEVVQTLQPT